MGRWADRLLDFCREQKRGPERRIIITRSREASMKLLVSASPNVADALM